MSLLCDMIMYLYILHRSDIYRFQVGIIEICFNKGIALSYKYLGVGLFEGAKIYRNIFEIYKLL